MAEQWTFTTEDCDEGDGQVLTKIEGETHVVASVYDCLVKDQNPEYGYRTALAVKESGPILAAAKELLAACEKVLAVYDCAYAASRPSKVIWRGEDVDAMRAAVAKARGG